MKRYQRLLALIRDRRREKQFEELLPKASRAENAGVLIDISGYDIRMKRRILKGQYEAAEIKVCRQIIRPGDCILELGAAIGYVGLFCLLQQKASRVFSVEPNPKTMKYLQRNYALNKVEPRAIEAALTSGDGPIQLRTSAEFWVDSIIATNPTSSSDLVDVKGMSWSSILAAANDVFTALLIDVEGAETSIPWEELPVTVKTIVIEIHPEIVGLPISYEVLHRLMNCGFKVALHEGDTFGLIRD